MLADVRDGVKMRKPRNEHMSAGMPSIADIARRGWHGRKMPLATIRNAANSPLFDHIVGASEERLSPNPN